MKIIADLVAAIRERLAPCGFGAAGPELAAETGLAAVLHRPRGDGPRLFCGVLPLEDLRTAEGALAAGQQVRRALARQYKGFIPWPGRMGTFLVLVGGRDLFEGLRPCMGKLLDTHARHVNVLLGAVLVNRESLQSVSDNILGLLGTRDEFSLLQGAVEDWCRRARRPMGSYVSHAAALSVA